MIRTTHSTIATLCLLLLASAAVTSANGGPSFSYDPGAVFGPDKWAFAAVANGTVNACGGASQSGIDIPLSQTCDQKQADYIFEVRARVALTRR